MLTRYISFIALIGIITLQSCSKEDPIEPIPLPIYHEDGEVFKMMLNRSNGVNIVFLGDGFTKEDLKKDGKYDAKVKELTDFLFEIEPFKQYKNYFNVYQVYAESKIKGAANTYTPDRTKFDAHFGNGNGRDLLTGNYDAAYKYAMKAVPVTDIRLLVMLVNDDRYAATGGAIATISTDKWSKYSFLHEVGHSFAGLADEYVEEPTAVNFPLDMLHYFPNVDNTSDLTKIKWAHLIEQKGYSSQVGAFEGGYYREHGVFRPEETSIMRDINVARFNAPSREAIVRTIFSIIPLNFDLNTFIREDAKNLQPVVTRTEQRIPPLLNDFIGMKQKVTNLHNLRQQHVPKK